MPTTTRPIIRRALVADIAGMHAVRISVRENRLADPTSINPADYAARLDGGWVAELHGRIVGFAMVDLTRANVWALFVDPALEGRGIGRRLHDAMIDWLSAQHVERVWLTTSPGTRAEHFYFALGWRRVRIEPNGEVRYERQLAR